MATDFLGALLDSHPTHETATDTKRADLKTCQKPPFAFLEIGPQLDLHILSCTAMTEPSISFLFRFLSLFILSFNGRVAPHPRW